MANRIFLAVDINDEVRERIGAAQDDLRSCGGKIRWVSPRNIHVTLCFLGDMTDKLLADVCEAALRVASQHKPFEFDVRGVICIPPAGRLRMLWVGVDDSGGATARLQGDLADALAGLGLPKENRRFRPHLTLARVKFMKDAAGIRSAAAEQAETDFGTVHAAQVTVYSSKLGPQGPAYTSVAAAPLEASPRLKASPLTGPAAARNARGRKIE